jgi:5-methylcytosine-specific restriction endonuclease McrA
MKRTELARATPIRPGKPLRTLRTIKGRPIRVKGVIDDGDRWRLLRILVWTRDNGQCVACGQGVVATFECHHRRLRSQGGPDSPENLITLCSRCHRRAHHNRNWARTLGYILHT